MDILSAVSDLVALGRADHDHMVWVALDEDMEDMGRAVVEDHHMVWVALGEDMGMVEGDTYVAGASLASFRPYVGVWGMVPHKQVRHNLDHYNSSHKICGPCQHVDNTLEPVSHSSK